MLGSCLNPEENTAIFVFVGAAHALSLCLLGPVLRFCCQRVCAALWIRPMCAASTPAWSSDAVLRADPSCSAPR